VQRFLGFYASHAEHENTDLFVIFVSFVVGKMDEK